MNGDSKVVRVGSEALAEAHRYAAEKLQRPAGDRESVETCIESVMDAAMLRIARMEIVNKCRARLEPTLRGGLVSGFENPDFIERFGPGMGKLSDQQICNMALALLAEHVRNAPEGKTGLPLFDN